SPRRGYGFRARGANAGPRMRRIWFEFRKRSPWGCFPLLWSETDCGKSDHRGEAYIGFFVARRDASKHLDTTEEVFDEMAPLVLFRVMRGVSGGSLAHRDYSLD